VIGKSALAAADDIVAKGAAAGNPGLGNQNAAANEFDVVGY
jgi:hypothetical protein